ncbi:hypothetical protein TNCV_1496951 [Trichonephila clavipes]|nr:hypothetical protein TNCV_1496951 [Trichonephila clavipes]
MIPGVGPVGRCITQQFSNLSLWRLQTRIRPSRCCKQKRDSSVNRISFHSVVHDHRSSHHWWSKRLWFSVKGKRSNGQPTEILLCYKRCRMVREVTE